MATSRSSALIAIIVESPGVRPRGRRPRTYYGAVGAFGDGRQVAYSGRSALVVLK